MSSVRHGRAAYGLPRVTADFTAEIDTCTLSGGKGEVQYVAVGLALRHHLARLILEQRDPRSGVVTTDSVPEGASPLAPVGTVIGTSQEEAEEAVDRMTEADPQYTARLAGRAANMVPHGRPGE